MGNSHGHKKSSSRARAKRRHSMPALSSTNHSKSEALGTTTAMPAPAVNDGSSGMLNMSSHHSTPFSVDPMAAMLAHHDKCRRPSSQMFQKTAATEEEKREVDVPLFDHYHPRPPLHNDDSYGDISLSFDALDDGDSDQDQDVSFFMEEEPSSQTKQLMPNTKSTSLLGSNNNNPHGGGLYNNLYNINSSSHSSSMRHSSSNHSSSMRQNSSGHTSSTMRSNSMRHQKSSPHFASPLSTVESQEEEKEIDHSRRRRRGSLMSKQHNKSKRDKPPPKSRRRASLDSSAYHHQADALLTNLEEVESFLRTLQKKDPEVRQRFLMESLQRQAGSMSDSSKRLLLQHNSSMNNSFLSASVSNLHDSSSGTRRMMNDSSTRSLRGDASTTGTTRRRKDKKSSNKQRRASGLSASASRLQTSGRRASDIALQASSGHGSFNNAHILNEELPPLMEQQSAHHRLPKTKTQRQSRRDSDNESKIAAARRSSGVLGLPSLAPMPSSPETNNKPRRRASLSQLPTLEEQKPQQITKPKYSKHNNNNNFLKKGFRRLSIGDTSKQALPDPKEYYYLERKNSSKRDKSKKSKKNRKSSSLSPARRKDHKSRRTASLSPKRKKTSDHHKKKKSTASTTGKEILNGRTKESAAFGRNKTVDLDYNDATMMDQSDYNHRIKTSGRVPVRTTLDRTRSKSQSRGKSPKKNNGSRSSRRRRSLAGWIGF